MLCPLYSYFVAVLELIQKSLKTASSLSKEKGYEG